MLLHWNLNYVTDGWKGLINKQRGVGEMMQSTDSNALMGQWKQADSELKVKDRVQTVAFIHRYNIYVNINIYLHIYWNKRTVWSEYI